MEVKPGYKKTDVGVIPEEWVVKPLKRISPRQSVGLVINPSTYFDRAGTVPLLVGSNVSENAIDSTTANRITKASNELLPASRLVTGDLVTVRVGEPGVTAVVPLELDGCNCASMMIVRQHPSFDSHWLCWMMNSQHGRRQVEHVQYGTAQKQFNISHAVDFLYPVPSLPEQRAIARALSDVDGLLGGLGRQIAKKRDLKQAAMQQLLTGQTRLPGFHGEWEVKRLDELGTCFAGGTPSTTRPDYWGGDVLWLPSGRVQNNILAAPLDSEIRITRKGLTESAAKGIKPHSVLVAITGATCANVALLQFEAAANQSVVAIEPFNGSNAAFLFYQLLMERGQILSRQSGSAQGGVNLKTVKGITIRCPSPPEQTAIASVLTEMDAELTGLEQRRKKTSTLKQAMMQELLTGRTRLVLEEAHA